MRDKILFTILGVCLLFLDCANLMGGSTETSSKVVSMLYNPGGSPAANAKVCFYHHDNDPRPGQGSGAADSTTTDANGNYVVILDTGTYNVLANGDSGLAFQDSIRATGGSTIHPPACTLKTPGTIRGVVRLEQGDDPKTVFILFMGTYTFTMPINTTGTFTTAAMAAGNYWVRILTTLPDYQVLDTSLTVIAGTQNVLPQPIKLKYTGIPTPKNLIVSFDTLHQTVVLSWDMPDTSLLSGYNVYRSIKGQNFSLVTQTPLPETQTVYYDAGLTVGTVYEYRVVSRTQAGIESKMIDVDADTALVVSRSMVTTTFTWNSMDTVSINDTVRVIVNYSNPTRKIDSIEWYLDTAQLPRRTKIDSSLSGTDTLTYYCPVQAGLRQLIVKAVDAGNTTWRDTFKLWVIQDAPKANGGNDTTVGINDTILLHGSATQQFGSIIKWEWKFGPGSWVTTGSPDTMVIAPATEQTFICSLAVTDDDGNRAVDGINIVVIVKSRRLAGGVAHSLFVMDDGTLWDWGGNGFGQLGDGTTTDRHTPVQGMSNVRSVAGRAGHSLILKSDNTLWTCGENEHGQLGTGDTLNIKTPVQVMNNVWSIAAAWYHSLILKTDGTMWAWGENGYGQLGDGTTTDRHTPVQVMSNVRSADAGAYHCLIVKTDGTLWACGLNNFGQLGDAMSNVQSVAAGDYHSLILKTDGTLWTCGYNYFGQLGTGDTIERYTPVQVMSNVQSVAAGGYHSLILKTDGTLWACGSNYSGQLGIGDTTNRTTPVRVTLP